jgi:hypothetical protein
VPRLRLMASDLTAAERAEVLERLQRELEGMRSYAASIQRRIARSTAARPSHKWDVLKLASKQQEIAVAEQQLAELQAADAEATAIEHRRPPEPAAAPAAAAGPPTVVADAELAGTAALWFDCFLAADAMLKEAPPNGTVVGFCVVDAHTVNFYVHLPNLDVPTARIFATELHRLYALRQPPGSAPALVVIKDATLDVVAARFDPAKQLDAFYAAFRQLVARFLDASNVAPADVTYERMLAVNGARHGSDQDWRLHIVIGGNKASIDVHNFTHAPLGHVVAKLWAFMIEHAGVLDLRDLYISEGRWPQPTQIEQAAKLWCACLQVADELGLSAEPEDCFYTVKKDGTKLEFVLTKAGAKSHPTFATLLRPRRLSSFMRTRTSDAKIEYAQFDVDSFYAGLGLFIDDLRRTKPEHAALLGQDVLAPGVTFATLSAKDKALPAAAGQLCLWTASEPIDFTWRNGVHPWAVEPPSPIVEHVAAMWSIIIASIAGMSDVEIHDGDGRPAIMRGPWQDERWRRFVGTTFSMRQRVAMIDAVERGYDELGTGEFGHHSFRHQVLQRAAWLPHVGTVLYHGTREESFLGDPDVLQHMRTVTFFSPDASMSQGYAQHNMLAFRVARELPEPMVHIQRLGDVKAKLTHDRLAIVWQELFGYPKSFFTRAAEIVAKLWGTGMLVSHAQGIGALNGDQRTGIEVVLCEPLHYLEPLPVVAHLRQDLFNGALLAYPDHIVQEQAIEVSLYEIFRDEDYWDILLHASFSTKPLEFNQLLAARLVRMFPPAEVTTWRRISDNATCLFDDRWLYNARTHGQHVERSGQLGYAGLHAADAKSRPAANDTVYVHDLRTTDAALREFFAAVLPREAGYDDDNYMQTVVRNIRTNTTTLLFAERQYVYFLRVLPWARGVLAGSMTNSMIGSDVVRIDNGLAYYYMQGHAWS